MRLGWRDPALAFRGPDATALRQNFTTLHRALGWPWVRVRVPEGTPVTTSWAALGALEAVEGDKALVVGNEVRVPSMHEWWLLQCSFVCPINSAGSGLYQAGFRLDGSDVGMLIDEWAGTPPTFCRVGRMGMVPVRRGSLLTPMARSSPGATTVRSGSDYVFVFMPLQ